MAAADAVWPTAPEGGGTLERLAATVTSRRADAAGMHPGSGSPGGQQAGHCPASPREVFRSCPPTGVEGTVPSIPGHWAVKPGDGAGCEGLERLDDSAQAEGRLRSAAGRLVAQPWIEAEAWSLSLLCAAGRARLLGCNRQRLSWRAGRLHLDAIAVNARPPGDPRVHRLGAEVAAAIPGLWGYVGVDFLLGAEGPLVLEVNPRLTTSYCALPARWAGTWRRWCSKLRRSGSASRPAPMVGEDR